MKYLNAALLCFIVLPSNAKNLSCFDLFRDPVIHREGRIHPLQKWDQFEGLAHSLVLRPTDDIATLENAKVYIMMLHGVGAYYSNPLAMLTALQVYTQTLFGDDGAPSSAQKLITSAVSYHRGDIYAEAPALPGSVQGPDYESFEDINDLIDPLVNYLREVKSQLQPDAKLVLHGRSFGGSLAAEIAHRHPELIDELILVSPTLPNMDSFYKSVDQIRKLDHSSKTDFAWVAWCGRLLEQMSWHKPNYPLQGVKTLILSGGNDLEVTETETDTFMYWSATKANIRWFMMPEQGHEVTKVIGNKAEKRRGAQAFAAIFDLLGFKTSH